VGRMGLSAYASQDDAGTGVVFFGVEFASLASSWFHQFSRSLPVWKISSPSSAASSSVAGSPKGKAQSKMGLFTAAATSLLLPALHSVRASIVASPPPASSPQTPKRAIVWLVRPR